MLTEEQKVEIIDAIENLYGDDKEGLRSALEDLILEAGPGPVKAFLIENTRDLDPEDYMDPNTYHKIKRLISEL